MMPRKLEAALRQQLQSARILFERDRNGDIPGVWLRNALEKKRLHGQRTGAVTSSF